MINKDIDIDIIIPSHTRYLRFISKIGENVVQEIDCKEDIRKTLSEQIAIVLTEGMVNAIKHANNSDLTKDIHIRIKVSGKFLVVKIYDNGAGFDLEATSPPYFTANDINDSGRGIFILKSLMDSVKYTRKNGENILEMRKKVI